ncbi:MAG: hypothetical protein BroJett030_12580 [Alphaproteobacteria bacterium]|nr:MAG: hypothetical protein BroJett030_12580 [Alphaproteobacteria bacterium]
MNAGDELIAAFALRQTAERYAFAVDRGDGELFAGQFMPDGVLEAPRGRFAGRDALAGVPAMMRRLYARTHHGVVGMLPAIDGDRATAQTHGYARHYYRDRDGAEHCYEMTIRYEDSFTLAERTWLIAHRRLVLVGDAHYRTGRPPQPAVTTEASS